MIVAVVDTNVLASGAVGLTSKTSTTGELLRRWDAGWFQLVVSESILTELEDVVSRRYFVAKAHDPSGNLNPNYFRLNSRVIELTVNVHGVAPHPSDDHVISAALSAGADYLVTGDHELRAKGIYEGVQFVTPREFVDILDAARSGSVD